MRTDTDNMGLLSNHTKSLTFGSLFKKKTKKLLIVCSIFLTLMIYYTLNNFSERVLLLNPLTSNRKTYKFLFWKKFFHSYTWYSDENGEVGEEILKTVNCPVTNCYFTHDKRHFKSIIEFDGLLFHAPEKLSEEFNPKYLNRYPKQYFIFAAMEAPTFEKDNLNKFRNFYNLTMTFKMNSDVPWFYGRIIDKMTYQPIAPAINPNWMIPDNDFYDEELIKMYSLKSKQVVWFASNCKAFSHRERLVKKMQQFIEVDIFGKCGNLTCKGKDCDYLLSTTYKFYLSFENSLCDDYVTEKLYRPLKEFSIPIVFNGAKNKTFYAPPKSFIDVNDYDTVEELVQYLKYLIDNPKEYIKYFWWKRHYDVLDKIDYPKAYCELCKKFNDENFRSETHMYEDINGWFSKSSCNQTAHIEF